MREIILQLIKDIPKAYCKVIKNRPPLLKWVMSNTKLPHDSVRTLPEHVYSALHDITDTCSRGNKLRWGGIGDGWRFCGRASTCPCAKESVSNSVSKSKSSRTALEIECENAKRRQTNLIKYGVVNTGQTSAARQAHSEFYCESSNVEQAVKRQQETMMEKYGVKNAMQSDEIRSRAVSTNLKKYGAENAMLNPEVSSKSAVNRKLTFDKLSNLEKNYPEFVDGVQSRYRVTPLIGAAEYAALGGVATRPLIKFQCMDCRHEFEKRYDYGAPPFCRVCNQSEKSFCSREEQEVFDFIRSHYSGAVISGDRSAINPHQLDIYLPELNLAIEYCGLYWHSECGGNENMTWNYHQLKMKKCQEKGIRLITMFSDEWVSKREVTQQKLLSILGVNFAKIGARKCEVAIVNHATAKKFYDSYHIQGGDVRCSTHLALLHTGQPVAMMSFKRTGNIDELVRYATSMTVVGGASKLLKHYVSLKSPSMIRSFADLRWSNGDLYYKLGFTLSGLVPPMQSYVEKYTIRHHKLKFKRHRLTDRLDGESEWQFMRRLGYDRIWDCGKLKFDLTVEHMSRSTC